MEHQKILDRISESMTNVRSSKDITGYNPVNTDDVLGNVFKAGEMVRDIKTGRTGEVIATVRKRIIKV